jgi:uncharacterized protein with GYD domain
MPVYVTLINWTDQGRKNVNTLPDRAAEVTKRVQAAGAKIIGNYVCMGRYDQVSIVDAPDDETIAKLAMTIAGRGNASTETLRCFDMDEVRKLIS